MQCFLVTQFRLNLLYNLKSIDNCFLVMPILYLYLNIDYHILHRIKRYTVILYIVQIGRDPLPFVV